MYAIVEIAGQQYKVENNKSIYVNSLRAEEGSKVRFEKVLLIEKDGKVVIGSPYVERANIDAVVERNLKGEKVIVFKKKRRKGYKVKRGHRQLLSKIKIENINA